MKSGVQVVKDMPTIMTNSMGSDLKVDEGGVRVWVEPDEETITIEVLDGDSGRWEHLSEVHES